MTEVLTDAVGYLQTAVERLAVGDCDPTERALQALECFRLVDKTRDHLPQSLVAKLDAVRSWLNIDETLEALTDRDVSYMAIGIVAALCEAVRLHAQREGLN
jgi:hypothetical protein